jgi:hypothetical protein
MKIALATRAALPTLPPDDRPLLDALVRRGVAATPAVWDDASIEWGEFDVCLVRSRWD